MRRIVAVFFLIEIVGMVVGLSLSLPKITYDNLCLSITAPHTLIIYAYAFCFLISVSIHPDASHISSRIQGYSHYFPGNSVLGHHVQVLPCCSIWMGRCTAHLVNDPRRDMGVLSTVLYVLCLAVPNATLLNLPCVDLIFVSRLCRTPCTMRT